MKTDLLSVTLCAGSLLGRWLLYSSSLLGSGRLLGGSGLLGGGRLVRRCLGLGGSSLLCRGGLGRLSGLLRRGCLLGWGFSVLQYVE